MKNRIDQSQKIENFTGREKSFTFKKQLRVELDDELYSINNGESFNVISIRRNQFEQLPLLSTSRVIEFFKYRQQPVLSETKIVYQSLVQHQNTAHKKSQGLRDQLVANGKCQLFQVKIKSSNPRSSSLPNASEHLTVIVI